VCSFSLLPSLSLSHTDTSFFSIKGLSGKRLIVESFALYIILPALISPVLASIESGPCAGRLDSTLITSSAEKLIIEILKRAVIEEVYGNDKQNRVSSIDQS
jgi:hypothetical protein